ncbi:glycosyltransferase [Candidatus Methylacidiphilum infernorum]|uniref:Glycosyltransferase n=1 Tax=Methylacidiphilum infernorum (isolate V4) TaxID=481448 RepID=B3DVK6_METI4|nr:glycosyltransferase [Candidatus Methylacidiphilum infernorum]ACD83359.1 Glycosyltransferase [Methylacidiphilum infernorum V4]
MKIAWFSPLPPKKSGIADFSSNVIPYLKKVSELSLFVEDYCPQYSFTKGCLVIPYVERDKIDWKVMEKLEDYDLVFFNMSNDFRFHSYAYELLLRFPGIVILHDYVLQFFYAGYYLIIKRNFSGYVEKFKELYSLDLVNAQSLKEGPSAVLNFLKKVYEDQSILQYPMNEEIISKSSCVITHSFFALEKIKKYNLSKPAFKLNLPFTLSEENIASLSQKNVLLSPHRGKEKLVAATFGYVLPNKAYESIFKVLQNSSFLQQNMEYWIIGGTFFWYNIHSLIKKYQLKNIVKVFDYQQPAQVIELLSQADICIALRAPTMGETSSSLLNMMLMAKPVVVLNSGWYKELPDDCVLKIDPCCVEKQLEEILLEAFEERQKLREIGIRAKEYILTYHTPYQYVENLIDCSQKLNIRSETK